MIPGAVSVSPIQAPLRPCRIQYSALSAGSADRRPGIKGRRMTDPVSGRSSSGLSRSRRSDFCWESLVCAVSLRQQPLCLFRTATRIIVTGRGEVRAEGLVRKARQTAAFRKVPGRRVRVQGNGLIRASFCLYRQLLFLPVKAQSVGRPIRYWHTSGYSTYLCSTRSMIRVNAATAALRLIRPATASCASASAAPIRPSMIPFSSFAEKAR